MDNRELFQIIAGEVGVSPGQVEKTAGLLDDGNTVPFVARYRKEATGELDEVKIRLIEERLKFYRNLNIRKEEVIRLIEEQGKLTGELREKIWNAQRPTEVEDLYRPYRQKRKTRASVAREEGATSVYEMYYDYRESVSRIAPHRVPAVNRGEREEFLKVAMEVDEEKIIAHITRMRMKTPSVTSNLVLTAIKDSYRRLIAPAVQRDVRNELTDRADEQAILIFSRNLRQLLLQPPVKGKLVLGLDPAYRTGCKWAVVDDTGKMLAVGVVYPTPPQNRVEEARLELVRLVDQYGIDIIAIGNGTASRETEQFVASFISSYGNKNLHYIIVNEAGASVYSASELAAREFPQLDVTGRSAVSIATCCHWRIYVRVWNCVAR